MSKDDVDFCLTTPTSSAMSTLNRFAALFSFSFSPMDLNERVNFNGTLGADRETRHAPPDLTNDITTLMESLNENNVYRFQKRRVSGDDIGGAVKDVILTGLHNLTEGEKTPLTDYNEAVQHLQRRCGIMSVAEQAKSVSLRLLSKPTAAAAPSATTDPPVEIPTPMVTENKSQDYEGMSVDENVEEDERPTEIGQILDELADGVEDTTLLRLSEEDVALDMDEVVVEVEEQEEPSDDDEDSEESGGLAED